jgi:outer membrane protein TolC
MKTILISLTLSAACSAACSVAAQTGQDAVMAAIETNNSTLIALREQMEAQKLGNRTGIFLAGPEVTFNYLWGNPGITGNRKDFSVTQSVDMATLTGMKNRMADGRNHLLELQYRAERVSLLLEAKQHCIELIYHNALKKELDLRLHHAQTIADAYKERLERGDVSRLEYNKALLHLSSARGEGARVDVERRALLSELKRLNGGEEVTLDEELYPEVVFPADFDGWYARAEQLNPVLEYVRQETAVSKQQVSLSKAMGWPALSAGYMSEAVVGQHYQGMTLGISIPLWENKNRVKQAKAAVRAAETRQADRIHQFHSHLRTLYERASGLKRTAEGYRQSLATLNNTALLKKALEAGEISLLDYMVEIGLYYDAMNQALSAERDYRLLLAELAAFEL